MLCSQYFYHSAAQSLCIKGEDEGKTSEMTCLKTKDM